MKRLFLAFAAVLFLSAGLQAQIGLTGVYARTSLASMPDVKKEIKLTKDQDKKLTEALNALQADMQSGKISFDFANPLSGIDAQLETILDDAQKVRLEELYLQANGGYALTDKKVAAWIELSDEQKALIQSRNQTASSEIMNMAMAARSNDAVKQMRKRKTELGESMLEVLNAAQKEKFEKGKGKAFKFKSLV